MINEYVYYESHGDNSKAAEKKQQIINMWQSLKNEVVNDSLIDVLKTLKSLIHINT